MIYGPAERLVHIYEQLKSLNDQYAGTELDGDWCGCVDNASEEVLSALTSNPPGFCKVDDE